MFSPPSPHPSPPRWPVGKASLATTIFLASCVQLLVVADYTPPSASSVPIIGIYYAMNSCLSALAVMSSILVLHTRYQGEMRFAVFLVCRPRIRVILQQ